MRITLVSLLSLLVVSACGTTSTANIGVTPVGNTSFTFEDQRPVEQRTSGKSIQSSDETTTLGDEAISPPAAELVRAWLQQQLVDPLKGRRVVLRNFITEVVEPRTAGVDENRFAVTAATVPGANPISLLLARALIGGIDSAKNSKTVRVEIEVSVDGKATYVRWSEAYQGRVSEQNVKTVVHKALDQLVLEVRAGL